VVGERVSVYFVGNVTSGVVALEGEDSLPVARISGYTIGAGAWEIANHSFVFLVSGGSIRGGF
jgi:hypothetical protein